MNKTLDYHNKKIFYRVIGKGKPVLLIHGFGEDGEVWKNQAEFLKHKYCLIIPDLPGSGKSELAEDMSIEAMAEVIKAILNIEVSGNTISEIELGKPVAAEGGKTTVIGHSMGGYVTLAFVEKYPERVSGFGLFHSTAYADSDEKKATRRKGIDFIRQHGAYAFLESVIPNLFSEYSKQHIPNVIKEFISWQRNFTADALIKYYEAMMQRPDRTAQLQKATVPVLFIIGKHDKAVPLTDSLKQCHLPEISYIHILQNSGHMGMLEEAGRCNRILEDFLQET